MHFSFDITTDRPLEERDLQALHEALPGLVEATRTLGRVDAELIRLFVPDTAPTLEDVQDAQRKAAAYHHVLGGTCIAPLCAATSRSRKVTDDC